VYANVVNDVKNDLAQTSSVYLTMDTWTSNQNYSYLGVTSHFFDNALTYQKRTLTVSHLPEKSTVDNLCSAVENIIIEWDIANKICGVVTDNAANIRNIGNKLSSAFNSNSELEIINEMKLFHIGCNAHILNLIIKRLNNKLNPDDFNEEQDDEEPISDYVEKTLHLFRLTEIRKEGFCFFLPGEIIPSSISQPSYSIRFCAISHFDNLIF
jgi:hypothetical protein